MLSKSAKCKALISKIDRKKKELKNGQKALILQEKIEEVNSEMAKINDEVEDRDNEGNRRAIDSIVHSRRQNEQHFEAIQRYKALQDTVTNHPQFSMLKSLRAVTDFFSFLFSHSNLKIN